MKGLPITILLIGLINGSLYAQEPCSPDSVVLIERYEFLHRYGDIYIGGQPSKEQIEWLKAKGVSHIVNLRMKGENSEFSRHEFDEEAVVDSLGLRYTSVPVGGGKDDDHPDKLGEVSDVLNTGEKVLLHCKTGARARFFLMAYLVNEKDCPKRTAKKILREMGSYFPLQIFLGKEIKADS